MFVYVGQTRIVDDFTPHGDVIYAAWRKLGDRYVYCVEREWVEISQYELNRQESRFIVRRNTYHDFNAHGLNFTLGGGQFGWASAATKLVQGVSQQARYKRPEERAKLSQGQRSRYSRPEERLKIARANKLRFTKPEERERVSRKVNQVCTTPEHRARLSKASNRQWSDPVQRALVGAVATRNWSDPSIRAKIIAHWSDPVKRADTIAKMKLGNIGRKQRARII